MWLSEVLHLPLEVIDRKYLSYTNPKKRLEVFRSFAYVRECYWIERLHTYSPRGLNIKFKRRNRHRSGRRNNPMSWSRDRKWLHRLPVPVTVPAPNRRVDAKVLSNDSTPPALILEDKPKVVTTQSGCTHRWFAFRDYHRRCAYLVRSFEAGRLDEVNLDTYRLAVLWRMMVVIQSAHHSFDPVSTSAVSAKLRAYLLTRKKPKPKEPQSLVPLVFNWKGRGMRSIRLRQLLESEHVRDLFPIDWPDVVLSNRLPKTVASCVFNFAQVAKSMKCDTSDTCPCQRLFPKKFRSLDGCVYTGDLSIVRQRELRNLLSYGSNFRAKVQQPELVEAIEEGLDTFIGRMSNEADEKAALFVPWKEEVLRLVRARAPTDNNHGVVFTRAAKKYLQFLQKYLTLSPTDKAANNVSFVCRRLSVAILKKGSVNI